MGIYDRDYIRERHEPSSGGLIHGRSALKLILITNFIVFLLWVFMMRTPTGAAFMSAHFTVSAAHLSHGYIHTLVTSAFSHFAPLHILFNMLFLWWFGKELEDSVYGARNFAVLYLGGGLIASLGHVAFNLGTGFDQPALGASGSVMAVLVVAAMLFPDRPIYLFFGALTVPLKWLVIAFIAFDLFPMLEGRMSGVAHAAHLGGALFGFLFFRFDWRPFRTDGKARDELVNLFRRRRGEKTSDSSGPRSTTTTNDTSSSTKSGVDIDTAARMDELLQKISRDGIGSLTDDERDFLTRASKKYKD